MFFASNIQEFVWSSLTESLKLIPFLYKIGGARLDVGIALDADLIAVVRVDLVVRVVPQRPWE